MAEIRIVDAGVQLWATVTGLCRRPGLSPKQKLELKAVALGAIAAMNGRPAAPAARLDRETARVAFTSLAEELARGGIENRDLAVWLEESWTDRERARRGA